MLFAYVTAEEAPEYRAIIDVLADAAAEYRSDLTRDDISRALRTTSVPFLIPDDVLDRRLTRLCECGNVDQDRDESWAVDLRSYQLRAHVYNLSKAGEAAHEAVIGLEESLLRTIGLQKVALLRVQATLTELAGQILSEAPDGESVYVLAEELHQTFKALTGNAGRFLQKVNRVLNSPSLQIREFKLFKDDTIYYLTEFTDHLESVTEAALPLFGKLDNAPQQVSDALENGGKASGEIIIDQSEPYTSWAEVTRHRLDGVKRWFVPVDDSPTGGQRLHRVVRKAVLGVSQALDRIRDAMQRKTGHAENLMALARRFTEAADDSEAYGIWHREFGMNSARHFCDDTVDDAVPHTRGWWEAPAPRYAVRLRSISYGDGAGRSTHTPDNSHSKRLLAEEARKQQQAFDAATTALANLGRRRLSSIAGELDRTTFECLVHLLARGQRGRRDPATGERTALSVDGRLRIGLIEPTGKAAARMVAVTGELTLPDYLVEITWAREA